LKTIESILRYLGDIKTAGNNPVAGEELKEHSLLCDASWNQLIYTAEWNRKADHVVISEFHFTGIHLDMLKGVIKQLVERHEILRTVFIETDGVIKQQVLPADDFEPVIEEHAGLVSDEMAAEIKQHEYGRVFDLGKSPLFFIQLLRTQNGQCRLLVTLHHIITDGYSAGIMQQELEALMHASMQSKKPSLAPLKYQYRDFSHWQLNFVASEEGQQHKAYWLNKLNGFTPAVKMPWAEVETDTGGHVIALLKTTSSALDKKMESFLRQHSATPTAAFMGALLIS
jgi:Condensation domain